MKVTVASFQFTPVLGDPGANASTMKGFVEGLSSARKKDVPLLAVFPEMSLTGYLADETFHKIALDPDSPETMAMRDMARDMDAHVVFGFPEKDRQTRGLVYNSAGIAGPDGTLSIWRKHFLPNFGIFDEGKYFARGRSLPVFPTKAGRIGITICYEMFFPEVFRALSLQGADIVINISCSPKPSRELFERTMPARAIETTSFFVYANLIGKQKELDFWGGSCILDSRGGMLSRAPESGQGMAVSEIDLDDLASKRAARPLIRDFDPSILRRLGQLASEMR